MDVNDLESVEDHDISFKDKIVNTKHQLEHFLNDIDELLMNENFNTTSTAANEQLNPTPLNTKVIMQKLEGKQLQQ